MNLISPIKGELSPVALRLLNVWAARCDARGMLPRASIDPVLDLPDIASSLLLLRRVDGRYQYRVVGSLVAQLSGRDVTGRWVDPDLYGDNGQRFQGLLDGACASGRAFSFLGAAASTPMQWTAETVGVPVLRDGDTHATEVLATFNLYGYRRYQVEDLHNQVMRDAAWYHHGEIAALARAA